MQKLLTLGDLYVSDFIKDDENPRSGKHELKLVLDENIGAPRLEKPWHFINEFVIREDDFLKNGGTFIVPCPKFKLINYNYASTL